MRGKVGYEDGGEAETRITPAYAGKRLVKKIPLRVAEDHPRVCGEKPRD